MSAAFAPAQSSRSPFLAKFAPRRPRAATGAAIALLHLAAGWALLQVPSVRSAVLETAPVQVTLLSEQRPPAPAPELPPPRTPPASLPPRPLIAVPQVEIALPPPSPQPAVATPGVAAPSPAPTITAAAPAPAAPPPPAERQIAITQVEYLAPPVLAYPLAARRQREKGLVQVRVRVDEQGRPERYVVARSSGHASLDEAALQTVRATRFKPYTENGVPLPFWVLMPLLFELDT